MVMFQCNVVFVLLLLTWTLKIMVSNGNLLSQWFIFRCHVGFKYFCMFTPTWENDPIRLAYFWNGLVQPPTGQIIIISICLFVEVGSWSHYLQGFLHHPKGRKIRSGKLMDVLALRHWHLNCAWAWWAEFGTPKGSCGRRMEGLWLYCGSFVVGLLVWLLGCFVLCCVVLLVWLFVSNGFGGTCKR